MSGVQFPPSPRLKQKIPPERVGIFCFSLLKRTTKECCSRQIKLLILHAPPLLCLYTLQRERSSTLYRLHYKFRGTDKKHNSGGNKSTFYRRPLVLIFSEYYLFEADARKREKYFKTTMGKKAIKLMLRTSLEKMGYKNLPSKSLQVTEDVENQDE